MLETYPTTLKGVTRLQKNKSVNPTNQNIHHLIISPPQMALSHNMRMIMEKHTSHTKAEAKAKQDRAFQLEV